MFKHAATTITAIRVAGSLVLLFLPPLSVVFFVVYAVCCLSDLVDGPVALHTWANKLTGVACVLIPAFYPLFGLPTTAVIVGTIASLSALEELAITLVSPRLDRNARSIVCGASGWDEDRSGPQPVDG